MSDGGATGHDVLLLPQEEKLVDDDTDDDTDDAGVVWQFIDPNIADSYEYLVISNDICLADNKKEYPSYSSLSNKPGIHRNSDIEKKYTRQRKIHKMEENKHRIFA